MEYLFRGVSEKCFQNNNGKLLPKKPYQDFASTAQCGDPHAMCDSGIISGKSYKNTVIFHQWEQASFPTSGISTTPFYERAKLYALHDGKYKNGYIYKLSVDLLTKNGVLIFKVNELVPYPAIPEDDEHIIVARDFGRIPEETIISIQEVENNI